MKVINVEVNNLMRFDSIYDSDNKSSQSITAGLKIPTGNYNDILLNFNFISPDATQEGLHLFATFKRELVDEPVEVEITSNVINDTTYAKSCYIPFEMLQNIDKVAMGVYGYTLNSDGTLNKRISLSPLAFSVIKGSYNEDDFIEITPTPTVFEIYFDKIDNAYTKFSTDLQNVKSELETDIQTNVNNEATARSNADTVLQNNIDSEVTNRTNADTNLQTQITNGLSKISTGTPLVASSTSGMTDTTRIYVNTSDGNWYYYNGSAWTNGGVYQATSIPDDSIAYTMIKDKGVFLNNLNYEDNIINKATSIFTNNELYAYDTTTFLPKVKNNSNYSTYYFDTADLGDIITIPLNSSYQYIQALFYIENTNKQVIATNSSQGGYAYHIQDGICYININYYKSINYEKVAICLPNACKYIYSNKYDNLSFQQSINFKQKISGKNITGTITTDKIDLTKYDLSSETEAITVIKNSRINGYVQQTFSPSTKGNFDYDVVLIDLDKLNETLKKSIYCYFDVDLSDTSTIYFIGYAEGIDAGYLTVQNLIDNDCIVDKFLNITKAFNLIKASHSNITHVGITLNNNYNNNVLQLFSVLDIENNANALLKPIDIAPKFNIVLPTKFKVVANKNLLFFHQNVMQYANANNFSEVEIVGATNNFVRFSQINSSSLNQNCYYKFFNKDLNNSNSKTITVNTINKNAGNGLSKNVLIIGDSLTARNFYPQRLASLFSEDVMNITMLGTQGTSPANHEGRSGWRAYTYVNCANGTDDSGSEITGENPFYNSETKTFDFSYYMSNNNYSSVDYVLICLGTNDVARSHHTSKTEILSYYQTIIDSIHDFDNNIKIGVWLPPARGIKNNINNLDRRDIALNMNNYLIEKYSNQEDNKIYLIPVYTQIDPDNDYTTSVINIDDNYSIESITDNIHPNQSGFYKIADVVYYWIKYFGSLDV